MNHHIFGWICVLLSVVNVIYAADEDRMPHVWIGIALLIIAYFNLLT